MNLEKVVQHIQKLNTVELLEFSLACKLHPRIVKQRASQVLTNAMGHVEREENYYDEDTMRATIYSMYMLTEFFVERNMVVPRLPLSA
jgi:hypothetical protein